MNSRINVYEDKGSADQDTTRGILRWVYPSQALMQPATASLQMPQIGHKVDVARSLRLFSHTRGWRMQSGVPPISISSLTLIDHWRKRRELKENALNLMLSREQVRWSAAEVSSLAYNRRDGLTRCNTLSEKKYTEEGENSGKSFKVK